MKTNKKLSSANIQCRLSYVRIFEPVSVNGSDPKYSASLIIPKVDTETIESIKTAIEEAKKASVGKWGGEIPQNLRTPLRDGDRDRPDDDAYVGCYFMNANSRLAPQVVDRKVQPMDPRKVYSGCYCNVSVNFYGYNANGNRGIAAGLGNIQFVKDGEPLGGGRSSAANDFVALDDPDDDDDDNFLS